MKNIIAIALILFALFGIPQLGNNSGPKTAPALKFPEPSAEMKEAVSKVAFALRSANDVDRALWAQVWAKAGKAAAADSTDDKIVWKDTNQLRQFTETALRIGWRRLGGNQHGKYDGLSEAVESAFSGILSNRVQPVNSEIRQKYESLCYAIAWAGIGRDQ